MQKKYRLTSNASFNYIYRKGARVSDSRLILYYVTAHKLKVGVSVSKKVGNSVQRSRIKRQIKECFRLKIPKIIQDYNFVITAKEGIVGISYKDLDDSLTLLLKKSGTILE